MKNVIIIGSGPAGYTAAIYSSRASLSPILFEGMAPGGQLMISHEVENFPGFPETLSGAELMMKFKKQAERFGAEFKTGEVLKIEKKDGYFIVHANSGAFETKTVIIATGATARRLPIPTEKKFYGRGVSGCATCDGAFFREKEVLVVGGGNTAMEDAAFLTKFASKVTIVHRRDYFRAAPIEVEKNKNNSKIEWKIPYAVEEITGENVVEGAVLKNIETGETEKINCNGIFVAIGHVPHTKFLNNLVELDDEGFIKTKPGSTKTNVPGIFSCGDVMDPVYKQAVTSAGTGCMAALDVQKFLEN